MSEAKPFCISKQEVWEAYKRVKANQGAAGSMSSRLRIRKEPEGEPVQDLESDVVGQLPSTPVRTVKIPKANGGERKLAYRPCRIGSRSKW